jgi:hypothetical protein
MENNNIEKDNIEFIEKSKEKKSDVELVLNFLKDPNSKATQEAVINFLKNVMPHPLYKLIGDISISGICFLAIIYCANNDIIDKSSSPQLITLVVGAIIGARFKA